MTDRKRIDVATLLRRIGSISPSPAFAGEIKITLNTLDAADQAC